MPGRLRIRRRCTARAWCQGVSDGESGIGQYIFAYNRQMTAGIHEQAQAWAGNIVLRKVPKCRSFDCAGHAERATGFAQDDNLQQQTKTYINKQQVTTTYKPNLQQQTNLNNKSKPTTTYKP